MKYPPLILIPSGLLAFSRILKKLVYNYLVQMINDEYANCPVRTRVEGALKAIIIANICPLYQNVEYV
jgi:hypothetical protein